MSIYASNVILNFMDERDASSEGTNTVSGVLNAAVDRYQQVVRRHTPELSKPEWMLLMDVLNAKALTERADIIAPALEHSVSDAISLDGPDKKWDAKGPVLLDKLHGMRFAELVAIVDVAERFWAYPKKGEKLIEKIAK